MVTNIFNINKIKRILQELGLVLAFSVVLYGVYFFLLSKVEPINRLKLSSADLLFYLRDKAYPLQDKIDEIVIVTIDDHSFRRLKRRWPWPRTYIKALLEKLEKAQPRLICLDLFMFGKEDAALDAELAQVIKERGNVIITSYFDKEGRYNVPSKIFSDAARAYGFVNRPRDIDFYVRRARPVVVSKDNEVIDYSFAMKVAASYYDVPFSDIEYSNNKVTLKKDKPINIPIDKDKTFALGYVGGLDKFSNISFSEIVLDNFDADSLKDKIVMVGATAEIIHDVYHTPIGIMPGVVIVANDIYSIIKGYFTKQLPNSFDMILGLLLLLITSTVILRSRFMKGTIFVTMIIVSLTFFGIELLKRNYIFDYFSAVFFTASTFAVINIYRYIRLFIENARLNTLAITDELTSLFTFRYFKLKLKSEFEKAVMDGKDLTLIITDIDHFKKFNDTYGHEQGNIVLKSVAKAIASNTRKVDVVCRYGGEEFVIILLNTNQTQALTYCENLRKKIKEIKFNFNAVEVGVTISLGAAGLKESRPSGFEELIKFSDECLYRAKHEGRDRVCAFHKEEIKA